MNVFCYVNDSLLGHALDADSKIFGHETCFNSLYTNSFQLLCKALQCLIVVQLGSVQESSGPSKD
jgi:hypothetical protein